MADYAYYIGYAFAGLVNLIVGVRLFTLSVQNAQSPERLLSLAFLFWALSYLLYGIPWAIFLDEALIPPLFVFSSMVTLHLGTIIFTVFTRAVFRNQERWARWLVIGIVGCLLVGVTGSAWVGDWAGEYPLSNPWWWMTRVGGAAPYVWMAAEGRAQYVNARRRQRLGLSSALNCNRFLLWGLVGALWLILELINGAEYIIYQSTGQWSNTLTLLSGSLEAIPGGIVWLIFFPPLFYQRRIENSAEAAKAEEG